MRLIVFIFLSLILLNNCNDTNSNNNTQESEIFINVENIADIKITQQITSSDTNTTDNKFGSSVALNNNYMIIGAEYANGSVNNSGVAYVYKKDESRVNYTLVSKLQGSDTKKWQYFGHSVDIDGNYAIVGSYYEGTVYRNSYDAVLNISSRAKLGRVGTVYLFKNDGSDNFNQITKIEPQDKDKTPYGYFGNAVAIQDNYIVIGANFSDTNSTLKSTGAVFVFKNDGNDNITQVAKLIADDNKTDIQFGYSVDIDGDKIVVGAIKGKNSGVVYVFQKNSGDDFTQIAKLVGSDITGGSFFGWSVSIKGEYIVVGAPGYNGLYESSGAVYVFRYDDALKEYKEISKIVVNDAYKYDKLGFSVSFDNGIIAAGAPGAKIDSNYNVGATYIFKHKEKDNFVQIAKIEAKESGGYFGNAVALDSLKLAVGAELQDSVDSKNSGLVYIIDLNKTQVTQGVNH